MSDEPTFDLVSANRYFAAECFNSAWSMMDKSPRTHAEDEQMLLRAFASFFHWTQRPDCSSENRSISLWHISRVYALLNQPENALRYGEQCLAESQAANLPPFYVGYAYEALSRAEMVAHHQARMQSYLALAHATAQQVTDAEDQQALLNDLETIR